MIKVDDSESQGTTYMIQLQSGKNRRLIIQPELNNLFRDLTIIKQQSELFALCLQQWNLLDKETRIIVFRKRSVVPSQLFTLENNFTYCHDIRGLFYAIELAHEQNE